LIEHEGILIASPEYNSSISGVLKNAIDWASRQDPKAGKQPELIAFTGKVAALVSSSPGSLGGLRALMTVRSILGNIAVIVLPRQFALVRAHEAFDENGALKDPKQAASVSGVVEALQTTLVKLHA